MKTIEWEAGEVVGETDLFVPALDLVAGAARLAQIPLMDIVCLVAGDALTHRRILAHTASVAGIAGCLGMRSA